MLLRVSYLASFLVAVFVAAGSQRAYAQWHVHGAPLCTAVQDQDAPTLVSDGRGGAIVAWADHRGTSFDIFAQRLNNAGVPQWVADGVVLCAVTNFQNYPAIVSDGTGGAIVAWEDHRSGTNADVYAQHVLSDGTVDPAWPASGRVICAAAGDQQAPSIISDGTGGAIVAWMDGRNAAPNFDVYAQHVLSDGTLDQGWPADGRGLCTAADWQGNANIVSDGTGGAIVAWTDYRSGSMNADVYAQHVTSTGVLRWTVDGVALCTAVDSQISGPLGLAADGAGGAIAVWSDYRSGSDADVYVQRISSAGIAQWSLNGVAVCTEVGDQYAGIVSDGAGGAIAVLSDFRSGSDADVYVQHISSGGVADWGTNGLPLCTATGYQSLIGLCADGAGGAIAAWSDQRSGTEADIYVQHVMSNGTPNPAWPLNGQALCTAAGTQFGGGIASDGLGGAIVAWIDQRASGTTGDDIFAQRIYLGGGVASASSGIPAQFAIHAPQPNPTHGGVTLRLELQTARRVSVSVYNITGQLVRSLVAPSDFPPGSQNLVWDGLGDSGAPAPAGIYFFRVTAGSAVASQSVAVLR